MEQFVQLWASVSYECASYYRDEKKVTLVDFGFLQDLNFIVLNDNVSCCKFAGMLSIVARDGALQSTGP